ncbi:MULTISPECIES: hypothetical protein [unclassified Curtobacterium]|uniref:hypothetical protein n=1 Tax=unclassified Curtobacterium TaxID=257496 RepID=UPI0015E8E5C8|nr:MULTISPECIES: hypothetical protein [unclassified Curtobacterium]WIB15725.1 hypothetical protein DEJ34_00940 [Curtobacterium sp. MCPF17_050]WIB36208.1 hypothetical protein DEJ15_03080 [Curtobacterium sp. MCJR17_043]
MSNDSTAHDPEGTPKADGLGDDGTVPNEPEGLAAGFVGDASHFNPEEDDAAEGDSEA